MYNNHITITNSQHNAQQQAAQQPIVNRKHISTTQGGVVGISTGGTREVTKAKNQGQHQPTRGQVQHL
jgi:hypothetical protein